MAVIRSLLFAMIFYSATVLWVIAGVIASLFGRGPTLAVVLSSVSRRRLKGLSRPGPT